MAADEGENSAAQIPPTPLFFFLHALYRAVPSSEVLEEKTIQGRVNNHNLSM